MVVPLLGKYHNNSVFFLHNPFPASDNKHRGGRASQMLSRGKWSAIYHNPVAF